MKWYKKSHYFEIKIHERLTAWTSFSDWTCCFGIWLYPCLISGYWLTFFTSFLHNVQSMLIIQLSIWTRTHWNSMIVQYIAEPRAHFDTVFVHQSSLTLSTDSHLSMLHLSFFVLLTFLILSLSLPVCRFLTVLSSQMEMIAIKTKITVTKREKNNNNKTIARICFFPKWIHYTKISVFFSKWWCLIINRFAIYELNAIECAAVAQR